MKSRKTILLISLVTLTGIVVPLYFANAQESIAGAVVGFLLDNVASNAIFKIAGWVVQLMNAFVGAFLLPVAASLLAWVFTAGEFTRSEVVQAGWGITRDLANMGFILVLLIIGFATILRYQEGTYGVKALIPKLILAALLINFSLVIAGVFIDVGNDLALFFISGGEARAGDVVRVDGSLINAMRAQSILQFDESALAAELGKESEPAVKVIVRSIAQLAITLIITFLFFAIALLLVFRMVYLWILLILAPFAWLALAIPKSNYWNKWWGEFIKWSLVPAVLGFFIYIAVLAGRATVGFGGTYVEGLQGSQALPFEVFYELLSFIAVVMILGYGLTVAPAWGGAGAVTAMRWAGKARDWSLGKVKAGTIAGGKFLGKAAVQRVPEETRRKYREGLEKLPMVGRMVGGPGARYAAQQKMFKDQRNKLKNLRPQDLEVIADQVVATPEGQARRAAAIAELAKKRRLTDKQKKHFRGFLNAGGDAKEVLSARPDWALDENIQGLLAASPATAEDWKSIAAMASGSVARQLEAEKVIRGKVMPTVASDFAKIQKEALTDDILHLIATELGEGGRLYVAHLNALGSKNPATYETLKSYLKRDDIIENLSESVQKHLKAGLLAAVMEEEKEEAPAPAAPAPGTAKT